MAIQPRPLPSETITNLVPPLPGFPFFEHADRFRFQGDAATYSAINAWWLADAGFLVYGTAEFVREGFGNSPLPDLGFTLQWLGTEDDNRGIILQNDEALVVVFRGTRLQSHTLMDVAEFVVIHEDDLRTDSQFLPAVFRAGGHVHQGFRDAFAEVRDQLDALVRAKRPAQQLWLTGHSLGGALATLAAAHIEGASVRGLYTYGCPRVGDLPFVHTLPQQSHYRFVHRDDWVPTIPPELLGYVHGGTLHDLPGAGPRKFWEDVTSGTDLLMAAAKTMARQLRIDVGKLPFKVSGLTDHAVIYYATLLWNDLVALERRGPNEIQVQ